MKFMLTMVKALFATFLVVGLLFSSGVFSVLLYAKMTGKEFVAELPAASESAAGSTPNAAGQAAAEALAPPQPKPVSVLLDAPIVRQLPELPAGCEIVSLTMLLNFYGINKTKMELAEEMIKDPTPIRWKDGAIAYWGNPNTGYVGDVTRKGPGFGIYNGPLLQTLKAHVDTAVNLTGSDFEEIERHIAGGIPVVVWTTIDFAPPKKWVQWDTPIGPIETTVMEHAALMVGYDEEHVYVNDPYSGKKSLQLNKQTFLQTWDALGNQAISYR